MRNFGYADLAPTFRDLNFDEDGFAEGIFANHSLIVTHDPLCAKEQTERRRSHIPELEDMAIKMVARLDAQDEGKTLRGCRASDRRAHSRFSRAVSEAHFAQLIKAYLQAARSRWSADKDAISGAELFDGKLALLTNVKDLTRSKRSTELRRWPTLSEVSVC